VLVLPHHFVYIPEWNDAVQLAIHHSTTTSVPVALRVAVLPRLYLLGDFVVLGTRVFDYVNSEIVAHERNLLS
jgi:hypothetical protein